MNNSSKLSVAAFVRISAFASSILMPAVVGAVSCVWNADNPQTAIGDSVAISMDNGKIVTLSVTPSKDEVIEFSGDAMPFADGAEIRILPSGASRLVFAAEVALDGRLSITNMVSSLVEYDGAYLPPTSEANPRIVAQGIDLSRMAPASIYADTAAMRGVAMPYFVRRNDTHMEAQFQIHEKGSSYVKCLKVRFEQLGADVAASVVYARATLGDTPGSVDFDSLAVVAGTPGDGECREYEVAQNVSSMGYGTGRISLVTLDTDVGAVHFTKAVAGTAPELDIFTNVCVNVSGDALDAWACQVAGSGGELAFAGSAFVEGPVEVSCGMDSMPTATPTLFAKNQSLCGMTVLSAKVTGAGISPTPMDAYLCFTTNDGLSASVWCQYIHAESSDENRGTVKGVKLSFRQVGEDVYVVVDKAMYLPQNAARSYRYGIDIETHPDAKLQGNIASTPSGAGYGVGEVHISFARGAPDAKIALVDGCTFANGTICATGGVALIAAPVDCLPPHGRVVVDEGADLVVAYKGTTTSDGIGGSAPAEFDVGERSRLRICNEYAIAAGQKIRSNGGVIELGVGMFDRSKWSGIYLQNCELANGASIVGAYARTGRMSYHPVFKATGSSPSLIDVPIQVPGSVNTSDAINLEFDIADVSADDGVDLAVRGGIIDWQNASQGPVTVWKTGVGTLSLEGACSFGTSTTGGFRISNGTLLLNGSGVTHATQYLLLDGGTLAVADSSVNALGSLKALTAESHIHISSGASLSFSSVELAEWTGRLVVCGPSKEVSLRIGTSAESISGVQHATIRWVEPDSSTLLRVTIDENGYVHPRASGTVFVLR